MLFINWTKRIRMRICLQLIIVLLALSSVVRSAPQEGAVVGTLVPPDASAQVTAILEGKTVSTARAGEKDGKYTLALAAGTYTIIVTVSTSSFPIRLEGIVVRTGETTTLQPLQIMPGSGKAVLTGRIVPPRPNSEVKLLYEGKERAAVHTDQEGKYEFKELPAGTYEVRATAPGHADDIAPVKIPENQRVQQTAVLFPIVATDGVDWAAGRIRATGIGSPPQNTGSAGANRAMTQRAALADAQRNLLRIVEQIKIDGDRSVRTIMRSGNGAERIHGFLKGYTVVSERELEGGRIEIILELPITGPTGLSRAVVEQP